MIKIASAIAPLLRAEGIDPEDVTEVQIDPRKSTEDNLVIAVKVQPKVKYINVTFAMKKEN